jgi:hypothetical protein
MARQQCSHLEYELELRDVPQLERSMILRLQSNSSIWQQFKDATQGLSPEEIIKRFNQKKSKIVQASRQRGHVTKEEAEFLNKAFEEDFEDAFKKFKKAIMDQLRIQPGDTPEEVQFKIDFGQSLTTWLGNLFTWLIEHIKAIFIKIKENLTWCIVKAKELLLFLYNSLKDQIC